MAHKGAPLDVEGNTRQTLSNLPAAHPVEVGPGCGVNLLYILATVVSLPLLVVHIIVRHVSGILLRLGDMALCRCCSYGSKAVTPADGFVVVTGASGGIGAEIARGYAQRGFDLVLVARTESKLSKLAEELRALGRKVHVIVCDLGKDSAATELFHKVKELNVDVAILVNNAGAGFGGVFITKEVKDLRVMANLNAVCMMELMHAFAKEMVNKGRGQIMNVSSIAGFGPGPLEATYHATKAFATSLSRAVNYELRGTGVSVTAACPGFTDTDFFDVGGMKPLGLKIPFAVQSAKGCADQCIAATARGQSWCLTGTLGGTINHTLKLILEWAPEAYSMWFVSFLWH